VYPIFEQLVVPPTYIPYSIGNQFPIVVQLVTNKDRQLVQEPITTLVSTNVQVITSLLTHIPKGSNHQPSNGTQPRDSFGGSSLGGNSPREPLVGPFGWPTLDPHIFIPPWY
jgi:hypothetical protein